MIALLVLLAMAATGLAGRAAKKTVRALRAVPGVTVQVLKVGPRKIRKLVADLWVYWYLSRKRHKPQERFLFGGFFRGVWARFRGLLGGRGLGKSHALMRKAILLALLNRGTPELPVWGAIFGRTLKEVEDKLLPVLLQQCAEIERDFGVQISPVHDKGRNVLIFPFGAAVYLLSYENKASLELARGYNLGWAVIDELEVAPVPIEQILAVINFAIRDPRARHKALAWASTPKGYKGMPRLHLEAARRQDPDWYLVHGTIYDNPHLTPSDIEAVKRTIPSRRLWDQEGLAICVMPRNTVFPEYSDRTHLKPHAWAKKDKTVVIIDWGLAKAYIAACKVNARGEWFVVKERKVVDTTRRRFREIVREFVGEVVKLDGVAPYAMACDRAVRSERNWLWKTYHKACERRIFWLSEKLEMAVEWGCAVISSLLEPADYSPPKLYLSDALSSADDMTMGMRGAIQRYAYETGRDKQTGQELVFDRPAKESGSDDPIDALRYGIIGTRHLPELHGGKPLEFLAEPEEVKARSSASEDEP